MELRDFMLYMPRWIYATTAKHIRTNIPEETKKYIEENHLYHITKDEDTGEKIIASGYLKPATGIMKYIDSYGSPVACMFAGTPSSDDYIKNLTGTNINANPYLNPTMIAHAVEIDIKAEELKKFKTRLLADGVIVYKGKCNLPENRVNKVQLVPDLYVDEKTGEKSIKFRKRTQREIAESPDKYIPSQEYLEHVLQEKQRLGYTNSRMNNMINTLLHEQKIESNMTTRYIQYNLIEKIKGRIKKLFQKKLPVTNQVNKESENQYKAFREENKYKGEITPIENIKKKDENIISKGIEENTI